MPASGSIGTNDEPFCEPITACTRISTAVDKELIGFAEQRIATLPQLVGKCACGK
jgi:hypothetical protein